MANKIRCLYRDRDYSSFLIDQPEREQERRKGNKKMKIEMKEGDSSTFSMRENFEDEKNMKEKIKKAK